MIAVVGEPGNRDVIYAGAASGGIFKSEDGGIHWKPIFDKQDVSSVSALAIAPSDANIVWAGTGETWIRSNISIGNGIYKSTDAGKTWERMGLELTGRIGRIVVDPRDPNVVYAAALGHCYGPQQERGVYRTKDGGATWERVLFVDENTGASDIALDTNNPDILIAGMWQIEIKTWVRNSGGPGSGLYMSKDGGDNWNKLQGRGLPKFPWGKIGVGIAPSNSNRIYALIETAQYEFDGVLFRSDNGGQSWKLISHDQEYTQRPHYYTRLAISPTDDEEVYFMAHGVWKTTDGGVSAKRVQGIRGDDHDMWIDPMIPDRLLVGNDGGVAISNNRGKTWHAPELPTGQMYHVAVDSQIPYFVYGNRQDGPSTRGPSNSRMGRISTAMWHPVGGGESGFTYPDPVNNNIIYSANYDGSMTRYDLNTGHSREIRVWPNEPMGWPPTDLKYRFNWTFPIHISPHDNNKVYVGSQHVHVTTNGGQSWQEISPDLTLNDKSKLVTSGGLTIDNIGVEFGSTLFAIAESPIEKGVIWAGSNDGLLHISRDDGATWEKVSKNIPSLPEWGTISNIEPSKYQAGKAYISVDFHQMNNRDPYAYKTTDYGKTWQKITNGIPQSVLSYVHVIREDPKREGLLYLGTENGIYISINDGGNWLPLQSNLPHAPLHWLTIQDHFNDLVVATYGRGFWIMDDITPLQQLTEEMVSGEFHLFEPREAYRFQNISAPGMGEANASDGRNPAYGASINYFVGKNFPDSAKVQLHIIDAAGDTIRNLKGGSKYGVNRVMWNLRHDRATEPKLRTLPLGMPNDKALPERLQFADKGWRPLITWGYGGFRGPLVVPGTYKVVAEVDGKSYSQNLEVKKDPNTSGNLAEIQEQIDQALKIRDDISSVADIVNQAEWARKQIDDVELLLKEKENAGELKAAVKKLDEAFIAVEAELFQLTLTGTFADDLRGPTMLYSKLMNLASQVQRGDFKPTDQQIEVYNIHHNSLQENQKKMEEVLSGLLVETNDLLEQNDLPKIVIPE